MFFWISLNFSYFFEISWNFSHNLFKTLQVFQNISSKIFTVKISLNIVWKCYQCIKNILKISYKFFRNFPTLHKISSKRFEYFINFFHLNFSKIFRIFPNNPAEIFKASFQVMLAKLLYKYFNRLKISKNIWEFIQYF